MSVIGDARKVIDTWTAPGAATSRVAYTGGNCKSDYCDLHIADTATNTSRVITAGSGGYLGGGAFSPDGRHLAAFEEIPSRRLGRLVVVDVDRGTVKRVLKATISFGEPYGFADWSPTGASVYFGGNGNHLFVYRLAARAAVELRHPAYYSLAVTRRPGTPARADSRIAVVTNDFRLVIQDATNGHQVRELASKVIEARFLPRLAVTPDGNTIYFDRNRSVHPGECPNGPNSRDEIVSVPTDGGPITAIAPGNQPAISPDGRSLAYIRSSACFGNFDQLVVRDLTTGTERVWSAPAAGALEVLTPYWASDSRHLAIVLAKRGTYPWVIDTASAKTLNDAIRQEQSDGIGWDGYYGSTGEFLGTHSPATNAPTAPSVVAFSPATGRVTRRLFDLPAHETDTSITADPGATNVLVSNDHGIWRWHQGERSVTKINDTPLIAAAWIGR